MTYKRSKTIFGKPCIHFFYILTINCYVFFNGKKFLLKKKICLYALLLEKFQIEMKYFCESFNLIYNYISKVALKEFINVFLLFYRQAHVYVLVCI